MTLAPPLVPYYPFNVVEHVVTVLQRLDPHTPGIDPNTGLAYADGLRLRKRRLLDTDDTQTVGVFPTTWEPDEDSKEMRGWPVPIHTMQRYPIYIQSWIVENDEMYAIRLHSYLSSLIRTTLETSVELFQLLRGPAMQIELIGGMKETVVRHGVVAQSFLPMRRESTFGFLATTEYWVDTQLS